MNAGGYGYGAGISIAASISDGDVLIIGNSMEQTYNAGIIIDRTAANLFGNVLIVGNQFASSGRGVYFPSTAQWISDVTINGNIINANVACVDIVNVKNMTISGNVLYGAGNGINLGAGVTRVMIGTNVFDVASTQIADASGAVTYAAITTTKPTYP